MGRQVWKIQSRTLPEAPCDQSKERLEYVALPTWVPRDQPTWCPLVREYDPNIQYGLLSCKLWTEAYQALDRSIPVHSKHGAPVNFFAPAGAVKFWVTSTHTFGFFLYYTLDKVVCLYLANLFGLHIFHPTTEEEMKALLDATVGMCVFCWCWARHP